MTAIDRLRAAPACEEHRAEHDCTSLHHVRPDHEGPGKNCLAIVHADSCLACARALLAAVRDAIVPAEPTEAMMNAIAHEIVAADRTHPYANIRAVLRVLRGEEGK